MKPFKTNIIQGLSVEVKNDNFHHALKTFTKKVQNYGKLREVKERQFFEKGAIKRKKAKEAAVKREQKRKK